MRAWLTIARLRRPAIAVAALYALVLGSFVTALSPPPFAAAGQHALCSPAAEGSPRAPVPDAGHRECCTLACPGGAPFAAPGSAFLPAPLPLVAALSWLPGRDAAIGRSALRDIRSRGPPPA
ncbi:hypothetical protein [Enterovirga aerilata]|uniref:DUF2946 domain-containing protein n=1 Tax=Enterovirga aerilata TaxID=2730920 RepID=A0A849IBI7_9HYPH|nr:hypothetical protein [Enterovirga sp. DB1703]NNM73625.1 hypothetical protein [Enterovirga sp. DB1703]